VPCTAGDPGDRSGAPAENDGREEREARRVTVVPGGPVLVEGPVEVVLEDGSTLRCDRFQVALCTCRRSAILPLCDASHRRRRRRQGKGRQGEGRQGEGGQGEGKG
jgi:CDGSH-type Zn-finger protein